MKLEGSSSHGKRPPQYQKVLWSQNSAGLKQVLHIYTGNKVIPVLLSTAVILAETLCLVPWDEASL